MPQDVSDLPRLSTGVSGIDDILGGGLPCDWVYLLRGGPGTGKTTFALQFLLEGARAGEKGLFITISQTEKRLRQTACSHGWSLEETPEGGPEGRSGDIRVHEIRPHAEAEQTVLRTSSVELGEITGEILRAIDAAEPERVVIDSMSEIRHLAASPHRYRRQMLALREALADRATTLLIDGDAPEDDELAALADGVFHFEQTVPPYGPEQRALSIIKVRGVPFRGGTHNYRIRTGGLDVFPRLHIRSDSEYQEREELESGTPGIDRLLGGGLQYGTACVLLGSAGTGKTTLATLYACAAAERGERAAIFTFDERADTFIARSEGIGLPLREHLESGRLTLRAVDAGELTPGEFAEIVRTAVERDEARVVVIDSLTGYSHSMPQEKLLVTQMHELLAFASRRGVLTLLVAAQHGVVGRGLQGPIDVSYLADTVVLLRHYEVLGELRRAMAVVVKRYGGHEHVIREFRITSEGVEVGERVDEVTGILAGVSRPTGGSGTGASGTGGAGADPSADPPAEDERDA